MQLSHYSHKAGLSYIDPAYHGTGCNGSESSRRKVRGWLNRSFWFIGEYRREKGTGAHLYCARVKESSIYDAEKDNLQFFANAKGVTPALRTNHAEQAIKKAGFLGYSVTVSNKLKIIQTFACISAKELKE